MVMPILNLPYELPYLLGQTWYYFLFFVPGLVTFYFGHHFLEPLWSIGVEEVFYLLWAPLFKWSKNKILRLIMVILFLKILINIIAYNFISNDLINYLISTFQFEAMAIGALGAYFLYTNGSSLFQWHIFRIPYQIVLISILCVYLLFHVNVEHFIWRAVFETPVLSRLILDFLFLYVIICVSVIPQSIVKLRSRSLSFLGEISYGIYMYHLLIVSTVIMVLKDQLIQQGPFFSMGVFYLIVIPLSIGVAALSKRFFEDYFLNLKNKMI
jgi:peptidoglycan/LPS O-acetylase OafA/YrhL